MKILTVGCRRLDTLSPCILGRPLQLPNAILPRWKMKSPEYSHRHIFCLIRTFSNDVTSECYKPRRVALLVSSGVPGGTWEAKFRSRNAYRMCKSFAGKREQYPSKSGIIALFSIQVKLLIIYPEKVDRIKLSK